MRIINWLLEHSKLFRKLYLKYYGNRDIKRIVEKYYPFDYVKPFDTNDIESIDINEVNVSVDGKKIDLKEGDYIFYKTDPNGNNSVFNKKDKE